MSAPYTRNMNQRATYWPPGLPDGTGGRLPSEPCNIMCRWESTNSLFRDSTGEERVAEAVVYVDRELENGGMLALGWDACLDNAREVRRTDAAPSLSANLVLHSVYL